MDGGLVDNIPLAMPSLKVGLNVVVHQLPKFEAFPIDYDKIPGRWPCSLECYFHGELCQRCLTYQCSRRYRFANATFDGASYRMTVLDPALPWLFLDLIVTLTYFMSYRWAIDRVDTLIATADPVMTVLIKPRCSSRIVHFHSLIGSNYGSVDDPPIHRKRLRWLSPNESGRLHHLRCTPDA